MPRSTLSIVLALVLLIGFTTVTQADVTGSFDLDISLYAPNTDYEAVPLWVDLQVNLQVNVTISGLTFGTDLGFGITGTEFAIMSLTTNLGALAVYDQFVFAEPFACVFGTPHTAQCPGWAVYPIGDGDGDGVVDRAVGFVKKRIEMQLNIAGITLTNLAIFEDVDFPDIDARPDHEHDHLYGTYDLSQTNSTLDDNVPTFGFGDVITLSGQTVSGITVTNITGICADAQDVNRIKKRSFPGAVNEHCSTGQVLTDVELDTDLHTAVTSQLFNTGAILATDFQSDLIVQTDSVTTTKNFPSTISSSAQSIAITNASVACTGVGSGGAGTASCSKQFLVTASNTNTEPVYVNVSVYGFDFVSQNLSCDTGFLLQTTYSSSIILYPGEFATCGWDAASVDVGETYYTDVALVSNPDVAYAITEVVVDLEANLTLTRIPKPGLFFDVEKIFIEGIEVGGLTIDIYTEFRPLQPWSVVVDVSFSVLDLVDVVVELSSTNILALSMDTIVATLYADNLTIVLKDTDADLAIDQTDAVFSVVLNPNQNPASLTIAMTVKKGGLTSFKPTLSINRGGLSLDATGSWSGSGGSLTWQSTNFGLSVDVGDLTFSADLTYTPTGFKGTGINLTMPF